MSNVQKYMICGTFDDVNLFFGPVDGFSYDFENDNEFLYDFENAYVYSWSDACRVADDLSNTFPANFVHIVCLDNLMD